MHPLRQHLLDLFRHRLLRRLGHLRIPRRVRHPRVVSRLAQGTGVVDAVGDFFLDLLGEFFLEFGGDDGGAGGVGAGGGV